MSAGRGGARPNAGRPSAFPRGLPLHRRSMRLPEPVWAALDALAAEWATTDDGAVARLLSERLNLTDRPRTHT